MEWLLWVFVVGGVVAVDATSFGQVMISRPLVAGTLGGWIVGAPEAGAMLGLILEALDLSDLPVGAAVTPETGPAALAAGAVFGTTGTSLLALLTAVLFGLVWQWAGGHSVRALRHLNVRLAAPDEPLAPGELQRRHLLAGGLDYLRGATMALLGAGLLLLLIAWLPPPPASTYAGLGTALLPGAVAAGFIGAMAIFGRDHWRTFAAGVGAGLVFLLVT
ncbi:hypothetical protein BH20GEM2_BH20GEM2_05680 [soil metagenome]